MRRPGQPKKITPHIARKIFLMAGYGMTDEQIGEVLGISHDTIDREKKKPEFCVSISKYKAEADLKVINALFHRAVGYTHPEEVVRSHVIGEDADKRIETVRIPTMKHYPPDTEACRFWLMNRKREEWRKEIQHEDTRPKPTMIRVFEKVSGKEMAIINRGDNQVDVLLGADYVSQIKAEENGHHHTNGNGTAPAR